MVPPAVSAYVGWVLRHGRAIWTVALLLSILSFWRTAQVFQGLRSDLESLLPSDAPAVLALQELRQRMNGIRVLAVVVDAGSEQNLPAAERMLGDLATRVRTLGPPLVASARVDIIEERSFFEKYAPLYVDPADLQEIRRRIQARKDWQAAESAGANLDDEPAPSVDLSDIEGRYRGRDPSRRLPANGRLSSPSAHVSLLLIDVPGYSTGTRQYEALMGAVRRELTAIGGTEAYAPGMTYGFAGTPALAVEELRSIEGDLTISTVLVVLAVILALLAFYRWWRAVPALGLPLLIGVSFAFSVASLPPFHVTWVNSNTAFLGSIIIGNGINFGIILLARYLEERRRGMSVQSALEIAIYATRVGTATAAAAAAIAYGSLVTTHFRGFWQFGVIGGLGMAICWATSFVLLPPLVAALDRAGAPKQRRRRAGSLTSLLASLVVSYPRGVAAVGVAATLAALFASRHFGPSRLETDFSKLRRIDDTSAGARYWGQKMEAVLGQRLTPIALLTHSAQETRALKKALQEERGRDGLLESWIESIQTFEDVLPSDQEAKLAELERIRLLVTPAMRAKLPPDRLSLFDRFLGDKNPSTVVPSDLPATLVAGLQERNGAIDRTVLVYPKPGQNRWQGTSIAAFTRKLRAVAERVAGAGEAPAFVAGQVPLSADITEVVLQDAPRALGVALAGVLLLVIAAFRWSRETALVLGSLATGVLWLVALTMIFDIPIHFANFIGFPIAFGIGVDYAVNVAWRHRLDGARDVAETIQSTGGAVGLCSLTTIIGYGSLLLADNRGLYSFGLLSVLGELTCLTSAVVLMPAVMLLLEKEIVNGTPAPAGPGRG
ncbi:MAG: MMPL family transporter [Deltaproteobacteria bacterium]|nr:MMPL family transporter [Deltaproteobacteria bacterium]